MHLAEFHRDTWAPHDGKIITIDGHKYRIKVEEWHAHYPTARTVIRVECEMVNKRSEAYLATRDRLGDDWFTDVLDSSPELQASILAQVAIDYGFDSSGGFYVIDHARRQAAYAYPSSPHATKAKRNPAKVRDAMAADFGKPAVPPEIVERLYLSVCEGAGRPAA